MKLREVHSRFFFAGTGAKKKLSKKEAPKGVSPTEVCGLA